MLRKVCCFRLNTAGIIVGWLGIVGSFLFTIFYIILLVQSETLAKQIVDKSNNPHISIELVHTAFITVVGLCWAITLVNLVASSLLLLGTLRERHLLLLPWLIFHALDLGVSVLYFISLWYVVSYPIVFLVVIILGLVLALEIYSNYGIYSLYKQMQLSWDEKVRLQRMKLVTVDPW